MEGKSTILSDFLLYKTKTRELCAVCQSRWVVAMFYIDSEDLFVVNIHPWIRDATVLYDEWKKLKVRTADGDKVEIDCHYIYI